MLLHGPDLPQGNLAGKHIETFIFLERYYLTLQVTVSLNILSHLCFIKGIKSSRLFQMHYKMKSIITKGESTSLSISCYNRSSWRTQVELSRGVKLWPNGTPNSSQLQPSYKLIKTCVDRWLTGTYTDNSSYFARKTFNCLTTNNLVRVDLSWLRWTDGEKLGLSSVSIWVSSSSNQLDPTQAKWVAKWYPTKLKTWLDVAWVGSSICPWQSQQRIESILI